MRSKIRILIAEDHPVTLIGIKEVIEKDSGSEIVGEAEDGKTALALAQEKMPDIAVLDIGLPKMSGLDVARKIREKKLAIKIIFLTASREEKDFDEALETGAKGYVLKDCTVTDIVNAIKAVAKGLHFMSPAVSHYLLERNKSDKKKLKLTKTERRIFELIAESNTSPEIADILGVAHSTIETHRHNICQKLEIQGQNALLKFALLHKSEF